jgi:hypothetical protein
MPSRARPSAATRGSWNRGSLPRRGGSIEDLSRGDRGLSAISTVIPHVTGLCRAHHDAVELHEAWIRLEEGVWNWYDRATEETPSLWELLGPLNPQPGSVEGKAKRRRFQGEAKKKRKTISIRVPDGADEDGAGLLDEAVGILEEKISGDNPRPVYFTIMDALAFTNLNAGPDDFGG